MKKPQATITVFSGPDQYGVSSWQAEWIGTDALRFGLTRGQMFRGNLDEHIGRWKERGYSVLVSRGV